MQLGGETEVEAIPEFVLHDAGPTDLYWLDRVCCMRIVHFTSKREGERERCYGQRDCNPILVSYHYYQPLLETVLCMYQITAPSASVNWSIWSIIILFIMHSIHQV